MTVTAIGPLLDQDGISAARDIEQGEHGPQLCVRAWSIPAGGFRRAQSARIPIDCNHDESWIGEVVDLQLRGRFLWAIGHLQTKPPDWLGPWYWSGKIDSRERDGGDAILQALAITRSPRQQGFDSIRFGSMTGT